jgi:hypothetical protein
MAHRPSCTVVAWLLASAAVMLGPVAEASDKSACLDAHAEAQRLRRAGHVKAARASLIACSAASCPPLVSRDCTTWVSELEAEQPTVIISSHDEAGRDVGAVRVTVDDALLTSQLDGRPLEVDPGEHVFRGQFPDGQVAESRIILRAAEKDRAVTLDHPRPKPAVTPALTVSAAPPRKGPPVAAFVLGGLGVAALGSFAYFGLRGRGDESHYDSTCRPNSSEADLDGLRRSYLVADISLGIAVLALGAATWLVLRSARDATP